MKRNQVAADVLQQLQACIMAELGPEACREYRFARTRGIPPADCNSITVQWVDRSVTYWNQDCSDGGPECGDFQARPQLRITLTRVCMGADQEVAFRWDLEDAEAACHYDHLEILEDCVQCGDWSVLKSTHALERFRYAGSEDDIEADGGAFSSYIYVDIVAAECC